MKIPLLFALDVIHGFQTINPIPLAESASWNLELIQKSASIAAKEAASAGINWTFAPMVDITRDPRWGRIMEGAGEDPYLGSKIAVARINGFQGNNLEDPLTIAACAKHFAALAILSRYTGISTPLLKKIRTTGHFNSSDFPIKAKS